MQVLNVNQYLRHEAYGLGVVTASDTERTTIEFESHGVKKFVTRLLDAVLINGKPSGWVRPKPASGGNAGRSRAAKGSRP
jgi:hypothetical protein